MNNILNFLIWGTMLYIKYFIYMPFIQKSLWPQKAQNKVLLDILAKNTDTTFGRKYNFYKIKDYQKFKSEVPIQQYESLRPYIEEHEKNKTPTLFNEKVLMYAQTSGTTGKPKHIPILESTVRHFQKSLAICSYAQYKGIPGLYNGKILIISSPAFEGKNESGTVVGSMSGMLYKRIPWFIQRKYVIPNEILAITDYDIKYLMIAAFSLAEKNITTISTANPSTFLKLIEVINSHADPLIKFIAYGDMDSLPIKDKDLKTICRNIILQYFTPSLKRSRELKNIFNRQLYIYNDFWPNLKTAITWMGGNCSVLIPKLQALLSPTTPIIEIGYLSTEFRGSIVVDTKNNQAIPFLDDIFYEFVEKSDWENDVHHFCTVEAIQPDNYYYIFVTTSNGLYRYFINDIIKVTGKYHNTPTIEFVQKGKGTTNLTGEKLYEIHLISALQNACSEVGITLHFFIMLADSENLQYTLYLEHPPLQLDFGTILDKWLSHCNIEFEAKLASGRLLPTKVRYLKKGTDEVYKKHYLEQGQREGQYKIIQLQLSDGCSFDFSKVLYE